MRHSVPAHTAPTRAAATLPQRPRSPHHTGLPPRPTPNPPQPSRSTGPIGIQPRHRAAPTRHQVPALKHHPPQYHLSTRARITTTSILRRQGRDLTRESGDSSCYANQVAQLATVGHFGAPFCPSDSIWWALVPTWAGLGRHQGPLGVTCCVTSLELGVGIMSHITQVPDMYRFRTCQNPRYRTLSVSGCPDAALEPREGVRRTGGGWVGLGPIPPLH